MLEIRSASDAVTVDAPAKVNLTLRVLGVRDDGYHELESVVAAVGLFDRLELQPSRKLSLWCEGVDVPAGDDNLVMKAARLLKQATGAASGAAMRLEKRIPAGRGFGGGSSDAAAALAGLNVLWGCGLGPRELADLGARVGSDVPLFFGSPVCIMRGRGERIAPVTGQAAWWAALGWPSYGLPTVDVYKAYDRLPHTPGTMPGATEILAWLDGPAGEAAPLLVNDLERAARSVRANGISVRTVFEKAGAPAVGMTGSGSAYFALADTEAEAERLAAAARAAGIETAVAPMVRAGKSQKESRS